MTGIDQPENKMEFYRDANGQLLSFRYNDKMYDYIYNQRGDIVAISNELKQIIARYTYDEWGNQLKTPNYTDVEPDVASANPFRYVGKYGVQYDTHTKLYFMGWRDYDSKIGRFIVTDEYEGEDENPVSFNRYLYAESDPVNNIDPDGHTPKWLKKLKKGVKRGAKEAYNFAIGDDIRTLTSKKTKWYQKAGAALSIASNFIPGGGIVTKAAKLAIKGTAKAYKVAKASRKTAKSAKTYRTNSKKVSAKINKKPKTVSANSIKSSPKEESVTPAKVAAVTPKPKPKVATPTQPTRAKETRIEKNNSGSKGTGNATVPTKPGGGSNPKDFVNPHSEKHMYDSSRLSTPNKSQYGEDVDVDKLRKETMTNPDKAYSNWPNPNNPNPNRITKYYKEFDGNISTPNTPTGSHRVFGNLDDTTRSSHFPYVPRK